MHLPEPFLDLQDLADQFAKSDDTDRDDILNEVTLARRAELVRRVSPRFAEIDAYLNGHDDAPAHLLGRLAEAAAEAALGT